MARTKTAFKEGNKIGKGRPKGSKNRTTEEIRNFIQQVVDNNLSHLETDLAAMNATNRWIILDKITKYFLPALTKNDNNNNNSGEVKVQIEYVTPPKKDNSEEDK